MALSILSLDSKNGLVKRRIFRCFLNNGKLSIPNLAKDLDYSVPTMTKYVTELCEAGFLCDYGKVETKEGRYPNTYGVNSEAFYFVGVDVHRFSLSIGIINVSGEFLRIITDEDFVFSNTEETLDSVCEKVRSFIDGVVGELNIDREKILSVNVNIAGRVNSKKGYSFSTFSFRETPLAEVLTEKIGFDTMIDNDTRAQTYGEYSQVYKGKQNDVLYVNIGWGIGIGIITNGKVYKGRSGYSGELGHTNVFDNDMMCHCGKKGCLETEVSGNALCREVVERLKSGSVSVLSEKFNLNNEINVFDIIKAINVDEDMLCIEVVENIGSKLGRQIANLINLFNPETVVIGGLIARTEDYLLFPVKAAVRKYSLSLINKDTTVVLSKLKENAGVIGACLIARDQNLANDDMM